MEQTTWTKQLTWTLAGLSVWLLLGMILQASRLTDHSFFAFLALPGAFLYRAFLFPALGVPLYLGFLAWSLGAQRISGREIMASPLLAFPLMTLSLMVRLGTEEEQNVLTVLMTEGLGTGGSLFFLSILLLLEGVFLYGIWSWLMESSIGEDSVQSSDPTEIRRLVHKPATESEASSPNVENQILPDPAEMTTDPGVSFRKDPFWDLPEKKSVWAEPSPGPGTPPPSPAAESSVHLEPPSDLDPVTEEVVDWDHLRKEERPFTPAPFTPEEEELLEAEEVLEQEEMWESQAINDRAEETPAEEAEVEEDRVEEDFARIFHTHGSSAEKVEVRDTPFLEDSFALKDRDQEEEPEEPEVRNDGPGGVLREANWSKEIPFVREADRVKFPRYHVPVQGILNHYGHQDFTQIDDSTKRAAHILKMTLEEFNIRAEIVGISKGPVVTMFEILPASGVKLSRIVALADNIALGLAASSVRIVAPIPGKHAVGIEVPNKERAIVGFGAMIDTREYQESKAEVPIVLGQDISGAPTIIDLAKTPHLLIAGATGAGKSVCVNSLICSILYRRSPDEVKLIMVDPKIVELKFFNHIPHLLTPVITEPKKALQAIQWALYEMERRYSLLDALGVRDIRSYNAKVEKRHLATKKLPYIVLVVDEFADLMATSGKELEGTLARLAAMSRAVGIHLVLATQRPSIDVITGLIKANFPSRIAFMVASKTDSRIIIDSVGAEKLLGRGDMLFTSSWDPFPSRIQGAFLSEEEVEKVVAHVRTLGEPEYIDDEIFFDDEEEADMAGGDASEDDPLWDKAVEVVTTAKKASASYLQRRLSIGYNRAARLVEEMERKGIVGPQNGSKARQIIFTS